jgi:carboxyl-terminal processing protease
MGPAMTKNSLRIFTLSLLASVALTGIAGAPPAVLAHASGDSASKPGLQHELDLMADVIRQVHESYVDEPSDPKMIEGAINGMLSALDPHSSYMNEKEFAELRDDLTGQFSGLGIEVTMDRDAIRVVAPMPGTPAARAGLRVNDLITKIDGDSVGKEGLDGSLARMRGPAGSDVKLTISRPGTEQPFDVTVRRDVVHVNPVTARAEGDVGYIEISTFSEETPGAVTAAISDLEAKMGARLKGYVIDLRNDPGGLLDQAVAVAGQFLKAGKIVSVKGRGGEEIARAGAVDGDITHGAPVVVLINGGTASAAEIVTGALQDNKRATVVGTRSFGKGTVQNIIPLGKGKGALRLTIARYYTPSGRSIQAQGIMPDVVVAEENPAATKVEAPSESSLKNHLKNPDGDETAILSDYVADTPEKDTQLQYALALLRKSPIVAATAPVSKAVAAGQGS